MNEHKELEGILLTPTELDTLYESNREYHEYSPQKWEQAICHAQVRKVVKWARTNCVICADSYPYDAETALFNWQALRAAGEGK